MHIHQLDLIPIELGFEKDDSMKGFPVLADGIVSTEIFTRLSRLSEQYGTKMSLGGNCIHSMRVSIS